MMWPDVLLDPQRRGRLEAEKPVPLLESLRQRVDRELAWVCDTSGGRSARTPRGSMRRGRRREVLSAGVPDLRNELGD